MNYHKPSSFKQCPCINLLLFMFCSVHVHVLFMFWAWQSWDLCSDPIQLTQGVGHCCDLLRSRDSPQFTAVIDKIQFFMVIRLRLQFSLQHQILLWPTDTATPGCVSTLAQPPHSFHSYFCVLSQKRIGHLPTWERGGGGGGSCFNVITFFLFIVFMGFSRQKCWRGLHSLHQLSCCLSVQACARSERLVGVLCHDSATPKFSLWKAHFRNL